MKKTKTRKFWSENERTDFRLKQLCYIELPRQMFNSIFDVCCCSNFCAVQFFFDSDLAIRIESETNSELFKWLAKTLILLALNITENYEVRIME